ncbi:MAG: HAMP domain-containing protein [Deltaproteobacteria bacterium]|nr:HAMP domain-containing protein [Deltaproteobacteria bacterium]
MRWTILRRLLLGHAAIILLVVATGGYVTTKLNQLNRITRETATSDVEAVRQIERMVDTLFAQAGFGRKYLISGDSDYLQQYKEKAEQFEQRLEAMEARLGSSEKQELHVRARRAYDAYTGIFSEELTLLGDGGGYSREDFLEKKTQRISEVGRSLNELARVFRRERDEKIATSYRISYRVFRASTVIIGLTIFLALLISFLNTRGINRPISLLKRKTRDLSNGRFHRIEGIRSPPEIRALAEDFNRMAERLKELDRLKSDFISQVSHELRTPLTAIREASGMLLADKDCIVTGKQKELLVITQEECERMIDAVNKILDISCMESGMMEYRFVRANPGPVIRKTVLKLAPIAQKKRIDLEILPIPDLPDVLMDEERIEQVLENLLGNALKYTPEGGGITVRAEAPNRSGGGVRISIADTGPGIPKEDLATVFHRFKRIACERGALGTGLGLWIAKRIIADHGGMIWAESEPGEGSTFSFTLPAPESS